MKDSNVADVVKSVAKKVKPIIEIDKTGPWVHVTIPEYNSWITLFLNDKKIGAYRLSEGKVSIQLSRALPYEYRIRAEVLKK
jgi:hypothetical protein